MYIDNYSFSLSKRRDAKSKLADRFQTVHNAHTENYNGLFERFLEIETSDAYILENKPEAINNTQALEMSHAMLAGKPIIILDTPRFEDSTSLFLREVIMSRLNKIMVCDISVLDNTDLKSFLSSLMNGPFNYSLTKHEVALIKSRRRELFRKLLAQPS